MSCLAAEWARVGGTIREATADYRASQDIVGAFLADCCVVDSDASAGATDLYTAYKTWCEAAKEPAEKQRAFGDALTERGYRVDRHRVTSRKIRLGLRLKSEQSEQSEPYSGKVL